MVLQATDSYVAILPLLAHDGLPGPDFIPCLPTARLLQDVSDGKLVSKEISLPTVEDGVQLLLIMLRRWILRTFIHEPTV